MRTPQKNPVFTYLYVLIKENLNLTRVVDTSTFGNRILHLQFGI